MEKKKVSVEIVIKYDHIKTSRIMEITTDEAGVKNLADWANKKSMVLNIDTQRFVLDSLEIESKPRAIGHFTWDVKTQTTTWHDVNGKPISKDDSEKKEEQSHVGTVYGCVKPLNDKFELERQFDDLKRQLKESLYETRVFIKENIIKEKVGFYVNQKQVDDLRNLIGRICLQGGDVKRRVSTSAYHIKNTLVWKLEKRQYTHGSMTLKQVYDLIYKYIVQ